MRRSPGVVLLIGAAAFAAATTPAFAHPFGPPPTAQVSAEGRRIIIDWTATPDDAVAIGELLGVMPEGSVELYRQEAAAQAAPSARDEARLAASPELAAYLAEHIAATQDGRACTPHVPPVADFVHEGARIVLTCPRPVTQVELKISMLHEIHEAYRTFAVGTATDPAEGVFTIAAARQTWRFGVENQHAARDWPRVIVGSVAGAGALVALAVLIRRRTSGGT